MEDIGKQIETLFKGAVEYGETTLELTKLKAVEKISDIGASLSSIIIAYTVIILFILFASLGLAIWLGEILGKIYLGFFAVAAIYGLLVILIQLFLGKWIKKLIGNYIIKKVLD